MNSTKMLADVESAQLGLGIIRSLMGIDADDVQNVAVKAYQDGNMRLWQSRAGLEATGIPESETSDDMGHTVAIGNEIHNHYEGGATMPPGPAEAPPPPAPPATPTPVQAAPPPASNGMGTLGKVAVGAALALGSAGIGAAIPLAIDAWNRPAAVAPTIDTDTDTSLSISIPPEDRTNE